LFLEHGGHGKGSPLEGILIAMSKFLYFFLKRWYNIIMKKWMIGFVLGWSVMHGVEFLSPSEITRGMKGVGYSVFSGWDPVSFDVEILDVMRGTTPEETLILARLSGQGLETSGVIAGMSGSPVYVDGKLVGAVAYAWSFAREALCGITPITAMVSRREGMSSPGGRTSPGFSSSPLYLWVSGGSDVFSMISNRLPFYGQPIALRGGQRVTNTPSSGLRPGDAVAVHLVDGDVQIQAVGTVTAVSGQRVWIFGHPLFQAGQFEAPLSRAYVYGVVPSYAVSFKLAAAGEEIGSVVYDGAFAVEGLLGKKADMISVRTVLVDARGTNTYAYRVIRSPLYQNYFLLSALFSVFGDTLGAQERHAVDLTIRATVVYQGRTNILSQRVVSFWGRDAATFSQLAGDIWDFLQTAGRWERENVRLLSLEFVAQKVTPLRVGMVQRAWLDKTSYQPGETIRLYVEMRDEQSRLYRKTLSLVVPLYLAPGKYTIVVGDPQGVNAYLERESRIREDLVGYEDVIRYYEARSRLFAMPGELWYGILVPSVSVLSAKGEMPAFPGRYRRWLDLGVTAGKEGKRLAFSPSREKLPFWLFYDVTVLPLTIKTNETRSEG